jgi:DNA-binding response OmpR family regulator
MKIALTREQLVSQLPHRLTDLPDKVVLEGAYYENDYQPHPLAKDYPKIAQALTPKEWCLFVELATNRRVDYLALGLQITDGICTSNCLQVHIKNIRKKLKKLRVPMKIVTHKGGWGAPGSYELIHS